MILKLLITAMVFCCTCSATMADDAPAWLRQASTASLPVYGEKVPSVVLLDESHITVGKDGRVTRASTRAIRILRKEGTRHAGVQEAYKTDTDKIREFRAWLIRPGGEVKKYEKKDALDAALVVQDVYNDIRMRVISAEKEAVEGAIFGYEAVVEERSVFGQFEWFFQQQEPVLASRLTITLPVDWAVESRTFNHAEIKPVVTGGTYVWELRDLPYIEPEPASPILTNIVPRLAISIYPPPGSSTMLQGFRTWTEVSRWLTDLSDPQVLLDDAMISKAKDLVSGAGSEWEKIAAIARFSQNINYVSIQMNIGRGGGYRPHPATETFSKAYGDCKDKVNLMRALLKAVGIAAYPVTIFSGSRQYARAEWPYPGQFNHCIIAVKVREAVKAAAIIQHETLGSLLIFDPTDNDTKLGDLPGREQDSPALLVAGDAGGLFRTPASLPEANRTERRIEIELLADGSIRSRMHEVMNGSAASAARAGFRALAKDAYSKAIESWISSTVRGAKISKLDFQAGTADSRPSIDIEFSASRYGQRMPGNLLVLNPTIISRRDSINLTEPTRKLPIVTESEAFNETLRLKPPEGFAIDELPAPVNLKTAFGSYRADCSAKDEGLVYQRSFVLENAVIPAEQYEEVRRFFVAIRDAEQSPVVLVDTR